MGVPGIRLVPVTATRRVSVSGLWARSVPLVDRLRRPTGAARLPVRRRFLVVGLIGVLLTLSVAATALVSLSDVGAINRDLGAVSRAQRYHQDADMMHDALRADVARAQQVGAGRAGVTAAEVAAETRRHAARFRRDLAATRALDLPGPLDRSLAGLRPDQEAYIAGAERLVKAAILDGRSTETALTRYQDAFQELVRAQQAVTNRLAATSARTERLAAQEEAAARRMLTFSSMAALAGWLALTVWLARSLGRLRAALTREAEQRFAADVLQRSLLPSRLPRVPGMALAARSLPGKSGLRVGGDWYDVIRLPTGDVGLVIGDVVGHDLPAASTMGQLRNALRAYALEDASPAGVLARVNRAASLLEVEDMATCLYAVLDPVTSRVRWASAGHLPPLVVARTGPARLLCGEPGPPLGVTTAPDYRDHDLDLAPGDTLLLYTDGLVERRGASIDDGIATLARFAAPQRDPEALCEAVIAALVGGGAPCDDVTLLALQT